jgi:methionine-rich copper-binding protein CopC
MSARTIAAALAAALCLGAGATTALAHTELESSSPRDGATLSRLPARVVLTYGEPIARAGTVTVGRNGRGNLAATVAKDPRDARRVVVTLKRPGRKWQAARYRVSWRIIAADGDPVTGAIGFRVR